MDVAILVAAVLATALMFYVVGAARGERGALRSHRCITPDERFRGAQASWQSHMMRAHKEREFWHGKYSTVKHENNVLRRKIRRRSDGFGRDEGAG